MQSRKQIYINLIVADLVKATAFYEAIGFVKNPMFSSEEAAGLVWSEEIIIMLLARQFAQKFTDGKEIADPQKVISTLFALSFGSKGEVDEFVEKAKKAGGRVYKNDYNKQYDFMYTFEVEDIDGYIWEPTYMDTSAFVERAN